MCIIYNIILKIQSFSCNKLETCRPVHPVASAALAHKNKRQKTKHMEKKSTCQKTEAGANLIDNQSTLSILQNTPLSVSSEKTHQVAQVDYLNFEHAADLK